LQKQEKKLIYLRYKIQNFHLKMLLSRLLKYSIKNILRNKFLSISSVLVLTLLMFFINILLVLHDVSSSLITSINSKLSISLYLDDQYDQNSVEVIDLIGDIKKTLPSVTLEYKTKDIVLEEIEERDPELVRILERSNPLPDTITLSDIHLDQYESLNYIIENKLFLLSNAKQEDKDHLSNYNSQYERINKVTTTLGALQLWLYVIIWIFIISIFVIIYSIIGNFIYYYRDEIYITRLVWWNRFFIYGPFCLQGMIYSAISFLVSLTVFAILIKNIQFVFSISYVSNFSFTQFYIILLIEFFVFILVWGLSWFLSSRKYLKK